MSSREQLSSYPLLCGRPGLVPAETSPLSLLLAKFTESLCHSNGMTQRIRTLYLEYLSYSKVNQSATEQESEEGSEEEIWLEMLSIANVSELLRRYLLSRKGSTPALFKDDPILTSLGELS